MKKRTNVTPENSQAVQLGLAIHRLRARMRAESPSSGGWSLSQLAILLRIIEQGPVTANQLAKAAHMRPQSVAEIVAALKAEKLIRAASDPSDERKLLLTATKAGQAAVDEVLTARAEWLGRAVAVVVGPGEAGELERTINLLNRLADCDTGSAERDRRAP